MFNLMEGNIDQQIHLDSLWASHSHNTTRRNWAKGSTKICNPLSGRGTVSCAGANGHFAFQANRPMDIDFLGSSYNLVADVVGSAEMANLTISGGGTAMAQVDKAIAVCGPSPFGPSSRSYDQASYAYSLGYGETNDDGSSRFDSISPVSTSLRLAGSR